MSKEVIKTISYKGHTIEVLPDYDPESPREWDNLSKMVCFHNRYNLGDKTDLKSDMFNSWQETRDYLIKEKKAYIILPLYLYDHSGITISVSDGYPYNDRWDSSMIGYVYATDEGIRKEFNVKRISKETREKARKILLSEVETYDTYLRGEVYGYNIPELEDSCYGFYGDYDNMVKECKSIIDYHIVNNHKKHYDYLKKCIKSNIPELYRKPYCEVEV